jgi:hypothetical protein
MWVFNPHVGGKKIPEAVKQRTRRRIEAFASEKYKGKFTRLDIRFRGPFCYVDAYVEPALSPGWPPKDSRETRAEMLERLRNTPLHLCRLRYFGHEDAWSLAFYTYSNEAYSPCVFHSGDFHGTPEEGFDVGATYLDR